MRQIYPVLFFLLFCSKAFAFDILNISTITDRNGLSQNTIRCMMQDSRGFMWMGTINGLWWYIPSCRGHRCCPTAGYVIWLRTRTVLSGYVLSQIPCFAMIRELKR